MVSNFSQNLGLPALPLTQNAELAGELRSVYNAIRAVMGALDSYTGAISPPTENWAELKSQVRLNGMSKVYFPAGEALTPGATVGFISSSGTQVMKADGTVRCRGFCSNTSAVAVGGVAEVTLLGVITNFSAGALVPGATYFQSPGSPGQVSITGTQAIGFAVTDQILFLNPVP